MPSRTSKNLVEVADALTKCGLTVEHALGTLVVDGRPVRFTVAERAHPTPGDIGRLERPPEGHAGILIADRVSNAVREGLRERDYGWLDRRGHLRVWIPGLRVEASFAVGQAPTRRRRADAPLPPAAREIVFATLMDTATKPSPRRLGALLDRSPGYISTVLTSLAEMGLLNEDGHALIPELFWTLAASWRSEWSYLSEQYDHFASLGPLLDAGSHGAAGWGAPLLLGPGDTRFFYVETDLDQRRVLERSTQATRPTKARSAVQVIGPLWKLARLSTPALELNTAHPLVCALDLASDQRGRETLESWRAQNRELGVAAYLDTTVHTGFDLNDYFVDVLLRNPLAEGMQHTLIDELQTKPAFLACLWQNPRVSGEVRDRLTQRLTDLALLDPVAGTLIVREAPEILLQAPFDRVRGGDLDFPEDRYGRWRGTELRVRREVALAVADGRQRDVIQSWARAVVGRTVAFAPGDTDLAGTEWDLRDLALFLLRVANLGELPADAIADLGSVVDAVPRIWVGSDAHRWAEWSSGPDPPWRALVSRAQHAHELTIRTRKRVIAEVLAAELEDRAIPLCELAAHLDGTERSDVLDALFVSAQAIHDLHVRAKVLAEASRHAPATRRAAFVDAALVAARAAVHQSTRSVLGGPDPGGIRGLLEVVPKLEARSRQEALRETAHLWMEWVDPPDSMRKPDRRRPFDGGSDTTDPLVRWLATERLGDELRDVLETVRTIAGAHGNALEVLLMHTAFPVLLDGDVEIASIYIDQAQRPTEWALEHGNRSERRDSPLKLFPPELIGFRNVWR